MNAFDELTADFSRLPGIGKKSAARMVNWLLTQESAYVHRFAQNLGTLKERIKPCSVCGMWTETDPCPLCTDPLRDKTLLCVVEQSQDVNTIQAYGEYKGQFHVLGGLIKPLEGVGPAQLSINPLLEKIKKAAADPQLAIKEVIIATNPTVEGDTTALYINKLIAELGLTPAPKVTRLATGIPVGGDLEYIDKRTLSLSFRGRSEL